MDEDHSQNLPDIDSLWNYSNSAESEITFRKALASVEQEHADYRAQLLTQIARSQVLQRQIDKSHATLDEAAGLLSDQTPIARIRLHLERGRAWNDAGLSDQAIAAFTEAFALADAARADVLAVDAAHMLGLMPPTEGAVSWNERAIQAASQSDDPRARRWIGTLNLNLGVNHQRLEKYSEAEHAFTSALAAFEQTGNAGRIRLAKLCLAKNQRLSGNPAEALETDRRLLTEMQSAGDPLGYGFEEIAECLLARGRIEEATLIFAQAYETLLKDPWYRPTESARLQRLKTLGKI